MLRKWLWRRVESRLPSHVRALRDASQREMADAAQRAMRQLSTHAGPPKPEEIEAALRSTGAMPPSPRALDHLARRLRKAGISTDGMAWRVDNEGGYFHVVVDDPTEQVVRTVREVADVPQRLRVTGVADIE